MSGFGSGSNSNGQFWYGKPENFPGFLFKKNLGVGARRSTKFNPGGNTTCNKPRFLYNKYKPGTGGIGGTSVSNRRAKNRHATVCDSKNCYPCYMTLGQYSNYTHNPNGFVQCPQILYFSTPFNACDLLPTITPYQVCSPWPQFGGLDNSNSRYTPILGSQSGTLNLLSSSTNLFVAFTSPAISNDGTIYIGYSTVDSQGNPSQGYLVAFNGNGSVKWSYSLLPGDTIYESTPAIGANGIIYIGSSLGYVYAVNPDGTSKWFRQYTLGLPVIIGSITASLTIGYDENIYFGYNGFIDTTPTSGWSALLFSIKSSDGTINWSFNPYPNSANRPTINDSVAIDKNNNIYFGYQLNNNDQQTYFVCVNSSGVQLWQTDINHSNLGSVLLLSRPTLNVDNSYVYVLNIYYQSTPDIIYLNAIKTVDGTIDNSKSLTINVNNNGFNYNSIARDLNDNLYFSVNDTNNNAVIYSVKNGSINWTYTVNAPNVVNGLAYINNSPSIGSDGTLYFGATLTSDPTFSVSYMYAVNSNGTLKWTRAIPQTTPGSQINNSSAINLQGNVIIISTNITDPTSFPINSNSNLYSFT